MPSAEGAEYSLGLLWSFLIRSIEAVLSTGNVPMDRKRTVWLNREALPMDRVRRQ